MTDFSFFFVHFEQKQDTVVLLYIFVSFITNKLQVLLLYAIIKTTKIQKGGGRLPWIRIIIK